jgi:uncharacterized lipoprotein YmbA
MPIFPIRYRPAGMPPRIARTCLQLALGLLCLGLAGCAADPISTAYYTLPTLEAEASAADRGDTVRTLVLEPIRVSRYLNGEGIVMQLSDIEVQQARNHLWAETLSLQLGRSLQHYLGDALPRARVLRDLQSAAEPGDLRVRLELVDFQGRYDGAAVASGHWQVRDSSGAVLSRQPFHVEKTLEADGYPALVRSLARAWATVAEKLAEDLARLPPRGE